MVKNKRIIDIKQTLSDMKSIDYKTEVAHLVNKSFYRRPHGIQNFHERIS